MSGRAIYWQPIDTMPSAARVFLFYERGEKGNGEIEVAFVMYDDDDGEWSFWTWGGPNSGTDYEREEMPAMWAPIEARHWPAELVEHRCAGVAPVA